jgi:hypothetical protein
MFHPDLLPLKRRIIAYIIAIPLVYIIGRFYYKLPNIICIFLTVGTAVFLAIALFMELKSNHMDKEFKNDIDNGKYHQDEKWQQKYAEYVDKHDFIQVKGDSMKADLSRRFLSVSGIVMLVISALFFISAIFFNAGFAETTFILIFSGLLFGGWGAFKVLNTPVRAFIKECGEKYPEIERSYLNGRMLTYKRNGELSCNCGINISGNYTVIYNSEKIDFIENAEIDSVQKHVTKTKYYGNQIYNGSVFSYTLIITLKKRIENDIPKQYRVKLNEFQLEMAYKALSAYNVPITASIREKTEMGGI